MMETKEAKALLKVTIANKMALVCCEGYLGVDTVPTDLDDFDSSKPETLDRCIEFLNHYIDALTVIRQDCVRRPRNPRQTDVTDQISAAEKAERQKVSKGDTTGREKAAAALRGTTGAPRSRNARALHDPAAPRRGPGRPRKTAKGISRSEKKSDAKKARGKKRGS